MEGYLKLEHVSRMRWRAPYTGAHGTVPQADSAARDAIIGNLFETYPPAEPTSAWPLLAPAQAPGGVR